MATISEVNAELDPAGVGTRARVTHESNRTNSGSTVLTKSCYCLGGTDVPGGCGWVTLTVADSAATQAAAVLAGLER